MQKLNTLQLKNKIKTLFILSLSAFVISCSPSKKELFEISDSFVESLETTYQNYGILGSTEFIKTTSDGQYQIMPVGRLINVKILDVVSHDVYQDLADDLKSHYKNDHRVNDVYINQGGTIMIDCRN